MRALRYGLFVLLLAPALARAQVPNAFFEVDGVLYRALATQNFGAQLENGTDIGPLPLVQAVDAAGDGLDGNGTVLDGCSPFDNAADMVGNIALVSRGSCAFVTKAENAADAGATAVVVYMDARNGQEDDALVNMGGDCDPSVCTAPTLFISRRAYKSFIPDLPFPRTATVIPDLSDEPTVGVVATGVVNVPIYDNGFFGTTPENDYAPVADESPLTFNGFTSLYVGSVLVGVNGSVAGSPYDTQSDYVRTSTVLTTSGDVYESIVRATFVSEDLGIEIEHLAQGSVDQPTAVVMQLSAASTTGADIDDVYLGLFVDWDVIDDESDVSTDDLGGFIAEVSMAYVFDADQAQYYGVLPIASETFYPGWNLSGYTTDSDGNDANILAALTSAVSPDGAQGERAVVMGQGPYTLPASGNPVVQAFALVVGESEVDLLNAAWSLYSQCWIYGRGCSTEAATEDGTYRLASIYPNPSTTTARVGFTLPRAEDARVEVFDLLGRRVTVLTDGLHVAGEHSVTLDAT
ncbi:MAG: PA domain-containing protein [Bacteroidota bacterium]